ncbi:unnamed protein product, partial [Phaedon cochleariae]
VISALCDDEGKYFGAVSEYLAGATYEVLEDLLNSILNSLSLDASTRFNCLEVLLREDVRKLDTGMFPQFYYRKILEVISQRGRRLRRLNLKGVWVRDYPELLSEMVRKLEMLETLVIPHMADDEVLESIMSLKKLTVLDICGEACYSVSGIRTLKSDTIRVLHIGSFGKTDLCQQESSGSEIVAELIENLPNLNYLRTYSYTGHALLTVYNRNPTHQTKLKYLHDTNTSMEIMESILKLCPALESLHFDSPAPGIVEKLANFRKLNSLKLTKGNMSELLTLLRVSGSQLEVLKLNHDKNTSLDLSEICLLCPNLVELESFLMRITFSNLDTYFMSLERLELSYCDMSLGVLRFLMTNSPFLKKIIVGCNINMTDGDVFRLCAECDFNFLEEVWFSSARSLTSTSVELLMGHCPSLRVLGQLSGW